MLPALRTNRKAHILLIIGMLSLVLALTSIALNWTFGLPTSPLHFFRGFFLGLSIVLNIAALTQIAKEDRARRTHQS
jgi:phosphate/sulfate permease